MSEENNIIVLFCIDGEFTGFWVNIYGHVLWTQSKNNISVLK
jgi:hypothetical protein